MIEDRTPGIGGVIGTKVDERDAWIGPGDGHETTALMIEHTPDSD